MRGNNLLMIIVWLCVVCLTAVPVPSSADDVTGVITGHVSDQNNQPLKGANVSLRSEGIPVSVRATSRKFFDHCRSYERMQPVSY